MLSQHILVGRKGEELAAQYLRDHGYQIIERNWRVKYAEIDLVAFKRGRGMVCVEVRSKVGEEFGSPEETLDQRKLRKLVKSAEYYIFKAGWQGRYTVDAICIVFGPALSVQRLKHYEDIVC